MLGWRVSERFSFLVCLPFEVDGGKTSNFQKDNLLTPLFSFRSLPRSEHQQQHQKNRGTAGTRLEAPRSRASSGCSRLLLKIARPSCPRTPWTSTKPTWTRATRSPTTPAAARSATPPSAGFCAPPGTKRGFGAAAPTAPTPPAARTTPASSTTALPLRRSPTRNQCTGSTAPLSSPPESPGRSSATPSRPTSSPSARSRRRSSSAPQVRQLRHPAGVRVGVCDGDDPGAGPALGPRGAPAAREEAVGADDAAADRDIARAHGGELPLRELLRVQADEQLQRAWEARCQGRRGGAVLGHQRLLDR